MIKIEDNINIIDIIKKVKNDIPKKEVDLTNGNTKKINWVLEAFIKTMECLNVEIDNNAIKKRIENAKKVKIFDEDEFWIRVAKYQELVTKNKVTENNVKDSRGCALPLNIANADVDKLELINNCSEDLIPVINKDSKPSLHDLIHEMMHVLANPNYVKELRGEPITDSDEAVNEFFARIVSGVTIRMFSESKKIIGSYLYQERIEKEGNTIKLLKKNKYVIKEFCENDIESIKVLAENYFGNKI